MQCETIQTTDLTRCAEIFNKVLDAPPWNEAWIVSSPLARLTEIAGTPGFVGLKAIANGRMIGFAMGFTEPFDKGTDFYLKEMCVLHERQGKESARASLTNSGRG